MSQETNSSTPSQPTDADADTNDGANADSGTAGGLDPRSPSARRSGLRPGRGSGQRAGRRSGRRFGQRLAGWVFRTTRNLLALAMLVEIVMLFAPLPERIYAWLSVATSNPAKADYIVCLGGGSGREATAAQLWHRKIAPMVIVSNAPGAAEYMRHLVNKSGVPVDKIIVDNQSYTTGDHPSGVARLPGVDPAHQRFVIVTDHTHTRRARACFLKSGYSNVVMYAGKDTPRPNYWDKVEWRVMVLPSIVYESAAMAKYWWQGKI